MGLNLLAEETLVRRSWPFFFSFFFLNFYLGPSENRFLSSSPSSGGLSIQPSLVNRLSGTFWLQGLVVSENDFTNLPFDIYYFELLNERMTENQLTN